MVDKIVNMMDGISLNFCLVLYSVDSIESFPVNSKPLKPLRRKQIHLFPQLGLEVPFYCGPLGKKYACYRVQTIEQDIQTVTKQLITLSKNPEVP